MMTNQTEAIAAEAPLTPHTITTAEYEQLKSDIEFYTRRFPKRLRADAQQTAWVAVLAARADYNPARAGFTTHCKWKIKEALQRATRHSTKHARASAELPAGVSAKPAAWLPGGIRPETEAALQQETFVDVYERKRYAQQALSLLTSTLSARDVSILEMLAEGETSAAAAREYGCTRQYVNFRLNQVRKQAAEMELSPL